MNDLSCREATRLVLEGQDRTLTWGERLKLRVHLTLCSSCPPFTRQMQLMKSAMGRWKRDADGLD